jgi:hypothetical protein
LCGVSAHSAQREHVEPWDDDVVSVEAREHESHHRSVERAERSGNEHEQRSADLEHRHPSEERERCPERPQRRETSAPVEDLVDHGDRQAARGEQHHESQDSVQQPANGCDLERHPSGDRQRDRARASSKEDGLPDAVPAAGTDEHPGQRTWIIIVMMAG